MGILDFFHKIRVGFTRIKGNSIPYISEEKMYGRHGEDNFVDSVYSRLPDCKIKRNIIIRTPDGNAELDCLILYKNKLFAVEVKRWKGELKEQGDKFLQCKYDYWTEEIHTKYHKSPFKQLRRAIYLLKKQIPENAWINSVVFFEESDCITASDENVWFDNMNDLVSYIINGGNPSRENSANAFLEKCVAADCLHSRYKDDYLYCIVCDNSLEFNTPDGVITQSDIRFVNIIHHWSYDELEIKTKSGVLYTAKLENEFIMVDNNGHIEKYALCKLDHIQFGN